MPAKFKEFSSAIDCPDCNAKAILVQHVQKIPLFGEILISSLTCGKCGFRLNDVMPAEFHEPSSFSVKIASPKDLTVKIVRSCSGFVEIPELEISIEPGPSAQGYFTNIEGLLDRMQSAAKVLVDSLEGKEKKIAEEKLQKILDAREAKFSFTVVITDPFGNSALIGEKVKQKKLSEKEVAKLKKNVFVVDLRRKE